MIRFESGETVLFRLKKSKLPILFMVIFIPVWLYFASVFLHPFYDIVVLGRAAGGGTFVMGLIGLLVFLPVVFLIVFSYFFNQLIITDRHIYVRKGVTGLTTVIGLKDIRSFQHAYSRSTKASNNRILLYLSCGEIVSSGELFITMRGLRELLEILRQNFEGRGFSKEERRRMMLQFGAAGKPYKSRNAVIILLELAPLPLALIYAARYLLLAS